MCIKFPTKITNSSFRPFLVLLAKVDGTRWFLDRERTRGRAINQRRKRGGLTPRRDCLGWPLDPGRATRWPPSDWPPDHWPKTGYSSSPPDPSLARRIDLDDNVRSLLSCGTRPRESIRAGDLSTSRKRTKAHFVDF